ncbi:FMN-linked oxidoreductase [Fomitiporia mediterranea MF3/22]|uniref:FMN-linked oxidoreductase n=1 Tax=Fomitiporia mediterranea (strain MF3/22) TaxID=694068 RepID=UPI0004407BD9|nr:FMN-linked oxidoreductase [Fomitiporia mediterranea MF3/22]EJD07950.1 FMN-linked oxidoreductase [Fomitiporia mediterranea MF3/22]
MANPPDLSGHPLFAPIKVGNVMLQHKIVMAPLTRYRADDKHTPTSLMVEYYSQRASTPGTLLITEGTIIAPRAGGCYNAPGVWNEAQIAAWKMVVEAVHAQQSFVFLQLWALGRAADAAVLAEEAAKAGVDAETFPFVSASDIPVRKRDRSVPDVRPRPLTEEEIDEYILDYAHAARNAVISAGFDGVEINCANGYLLDQFLQDVSNVRNDSYGDSISARAKFPLRVLDAVVSAVGAERTSLRVSPWNEYLGMRMADPLPTFSYLITEAHCRHPMLAYLHVVEGARQGDSNDFARNLWKQGRKDGEVVFLSASGHDRATALHRTENGDVVVFGRWFISNPDLPHRIKDNIEFTPYDYPTFYARMSPKGYVDYAFAQDPNVRECKDAEMNGLPETAPLAERGHPKLSGIWNVTAAQAGDG